MSDPNLPPTIPTQPTARHGCLTAWLIFMIIANAATAVVTPLNTEGMRQAGLHPSTLTIGVIVICCIANVFFAIALLRWKRWGFLGFVVTSLVALATNLYVGIGILQSVFGLVGILILYWVLNMGGERKAWPRLQ